MYFVHIKFAKKKCEQVLDFLMEGAGGEPPSQLPPGSDLKEMWQEMIFCRDRKGRNALQTFIDENRVDVAKRFLDMHISTTGMSK